MSKDKQQKPVVSQRFVKEVRRQFAEEMGESLEFSDYQKKLAQHMFLKVDESLKEFEDRRLSKNNKKTPYTWDNVNMKSLALEAVYKVSLGLDALMKNHVHPVPYYNKHNKNYDIELTTGYKGLIYIAKNYSLDPQPIDIKAELVHENDHFVPLKSNFEREVESYEFEIKNPFDRGQVQGGFGYIQFNNPELNQLVLVQKEDLEKAEKAAPMQAIWDKWREKMQRKTVVRRTVDEIDLDPEKTNAKALVHEETGHTENKVQREIEENANSEVIDIESPREEKPEQEEPEPEPESEKEQPDQEENDADNQEGPGF